MMIHKKMKWRILLIISHTSEYNMFEINACLSFSRIIAD